MSKTRLWDKLGKTDPSNTKSFKRAGGFSGTAIKPMWSFKRMTEEFGPCGTGWGVNQPSFQVVNGCDGEVLVYCTVAVWYNEASQEKDYTNHEVYGVGGDKVVVKQSSGLRSDDEAFKKAYTDAIGNALKLIGVGADVHMGLFDDSKYVNEMRQEFADEAPKSQQRKPVAAEGTQKVVEGPKGFNGHLSSITAAKDNKELKKVWEAIDADQALSQEDYNQLKAGVNQRKTQLTKPEGYVEPDFSKLPQQTQQAVKNLGA